jgi:hypothetical protein
MSLEVYSHLCAARDRAACAREALDASHAAVNENGAPRRCGCSNGCGNKHRSECRLRPAGVSDVKAPVLDRAQKKRGPAERASHLSSVVVLG